MYSLSVRLMCTFRPYGSLLKEIAECRVWRRDWCAFAQPGSHAGSRYRFRTKGKAFATAAQAHSVYSQRTVSDDCFAKTLDDTGLRILQGFVTEAWCLMQASKDQCLPQKTADLEAATLPDHAKQQVMSA